MNQSKVETCKNWTLSEQHVTTTAVVLLIFFIDFNYSIANSFPCFVDILHNRYYSLNTLCVI